MAVLSGVGGWSGVIVPANLDPEVPFGALGFVGAMQDLPEKTAAGGQLYVFALPDRSRTMPATRPTPLLEGPSAPPLGEGQQTGDPERHDPPAEGGRSP